MFKVRVKFIWKKKYENDAEDGICEMANNTDTQKSPYNCVSMMVVCFSIFQLRHASSNA